MTEFENSINNIEVTDNPDGSANITMDINDYAQKTLMKQGLQYLIDEMKMRDEIIVLEPNEFTGQAKNWELSDDDRNALFHFGFIHALRLGLEKEEKLPLSNTHDEWKILAGLWIDGAELQWFDKSPAADQEWFDFKKDDAWYPYDENLVIRVKTIEKERR